MIEIIGPNQEKLRNSGRFQQWLNGFDRSTAKIMTVEEGWSLWKGKNEDELVFALLFLRCLDEEGREKGDVVFWRTDAAAVFLVVRDTDTAEKYVILVEQLRIPAGGKLLEIPAGGIEDTEDSLQTVVREVREEAGLMIVPEKFKFLCSYFPSPGASSEKIFLYSCETPLDGAKIKCLQNALTGTKGEHTKVKIYPLNNFESLSIVDGKTLLAYMLYLNGG